MEGKREFDRSILPTILLILILGGCFLIGSVRVNKIAIQNCREVLDDASSQFVSEIQRDMKLHRQKLEVIAEIIAEYEDISSEEAKAHMSSIQQRGVFHSLTVLLPDNQVVFYKNGAYRKQKALLDFKEESEKGAYVSGVIPSERNEKEKFIYQAVPIVSGGEIKGILYELINLDTFPKKYSTEAYGGKARLYILDGETGDFLMDTWHEELGNLYDGSMGTRETKRGYDYNQWIEDLKAGKEGRLIFKSRKADEYFYNYTKPIGINSWMAQITAPESVVFKGAIRMRKVLHGLAAVNVFLLLLYFIWGLFRMRRRAVYHERQLQQMTYMYDVQKCLFEAHKHREKMTEALQKAGTMLTASATFLCSLKKMKIGEIYQWSDGTAEQKELMKKENLQKIMDQFGEKIAGGESILSESLMMVPINNSDGKLIGVLGAMDMKQSWKEPVLLECVAWNFMMALKNMQSRQIIQRMGTIDETTMLKNRNSYEEALREYRKKKSRISCCIYMDADGLHELNNILGHSAGDAMLHYIGKVIISQFGSDNAYRIGGDEFVVFCKDISEEEMSRKISQMEEQIEMKDYHVSAGVAWYEESMKPEELILAAEQEMYEAKRKYYREQGNVQKTRKMNSKLEKILLEKKDADRFMSIISKYFRGVYVVDLNTNDIRVIYQSAYFAEALNRKDTGFEQAMEIYADSYVQEDDRDTFCQFIQFENVKKELQEESIPSLMYQRKDGKHLVLHIYRSADYSEEKQETFWIFEERNKHHS